PPRAPLVLHRVRLLAPASRVKLHRVRDAVEPEALRPQRERAHHAHTRPVRLLGGVHALVQDVPRGRVRVVDPDAVDVDQRGAPLAVEQVIERRERQDLVDLHQPAPLAIVTPVSPRFTRYVARTPASTSPSTVTL